MTTQSNIEKIKQVLKEINDARERATQGEWYPCGCRFSMLSNDLNEQEVLDIADFGVQNYLTIEQVEMNVRFTSIAANKITSLTKALEVAVEAIEEYSDLHYAPKLNEALDQVATILKRSEDE